MLKSIFYTIFLTLFLSGFIVIFLYFTFPGHHQFLDGYLNKNSIDLTEVKTFSIKNFLIIWISSFLLVLLIVMTHSVAYKDSISAVFLKMGIFYSFIFTSILYIFDLAGGFNFFMKNSILLIEVILPIVTSYGIYRALKRN